MKIIKNTLLLSILASSVVMADKVPDGWLAKGTQISGTVQSFKQLPQKGVENVATLKLAKFDIPEPYASVTNNCNAYLIKQNSAWMLHDIICDYKQDEVVKIYVSSATLSQSPLNVGDQITITANENVPLPGSFKGFTFKKSEIKNYW